MRHVRPGISLFLLLFSGIAVFADVRNDFDPDAPFSAYRTFSFVGEFELEKTGLLADPENRERLKNFISGVLETRGLKEVPRDQKFHLAVRYWVARRAKTDITTTLNYDPLAFGGYWGGYPPYWGGVWGHYYEEYVVRNYVEGTLIVDLIDPQSKELVWRTYLREQFDDRSKAYGQAKKHLTKAFSSYPPDAKERDQARKRRARHSAR